MSLDGALGLVCAHVSIYHEPEQIYKNVGRVQIRAGEGEDPVSDQPVETKTVSAGLRACFPPVRVCMCACV